MFYPQSFYPADNCSFAFEVDVPVPKSVDHQVLWDFVDHLPVGLPIADTGCEQDNCKSQSKVRARMRPDHLSVQLAA